MITRSRRDVLRAALAGAALVGMSVKSRASPGGTYISFDSLGARPNDPAFDSTPALNSALAQRVRNLYIPPGHWYFLTKPNDIEHPLEIVGEGFAASYLVRRYAPISPLDALLSIRSPDCRVARLGVGAGLQTAGGAAIALLANGVSTSDFSVVEDVYVSIEHAFPGTWEDGIVIDGTERSADPIGVRAVEVRNCYLFASTNAACRISGGVSVTIRGGGMYPAAGKTGRVQVTGSHSVRSHYITIDTGYIGGLCLDHCRYVNVRAGVIGGDITNERSAEDIVVSGRCTGAVQRSWTRGHVYEPGSDEVASVPATPRAPTARRQAATARRFPMWNRR